MHTNVLPLPRDLQDLIRDHAAARVIQHVFRQTLYRHARHLRWADLRRTLIISMCVSEFEEFGRSSGVRREWRTEPDSWMYALRENGTTLTRTIISEIRQGLWR